MSDGWNHGRSTYLKHKCRCAVCVEDARKYRATYRKTTIKLDADCLIHRLQLDGRSGAVTSSLLAKWRKTGMDIYNADRWAVKLGYHPIEIWGLDFYEGCMEDV